MSQDQERIIPWLRLTLTPGIGPVIGAKLIAACGSAAGVFAAGSGALKKVVGEDLARALSDPKYLDRAHQERERCFQQGFQVITLDDPAYPPLLKEIADPPLLLYLAGSYTKSDENAVALVGSRHPDAYGESMATSLAAGLARRGITVVSGLARGVDGIAQTAALKAGGRSLAVLGTGLDVIYPRENRQLYEALREKGALLSEFPLGTPATPSNFPRRNRLISGLCLGVVMVQALSLKSGALITIRHALEQNRAVFAVPGNAGTRAGRAGNALIKQGARLVETAEDILLDLLPLTVWAEQGITLSPKSLQPKLPELQARLYSLIPSPAEGTVEIDALSRRAGLEPAKAQTALLELELAGLVRALPGKRYVRLTGD